MTIYLVGIGMGDASSITVKGQRIIEQCEVLIGAKRMMETAIKLKGRSAKKELISYKIEEIIPFIEECVKDNEEDMAILLSGDVGFFSGAAKIAEQLSNYNIKLVPGISSVNYFVSQIEMSWHNMTLVSAHGRDISLVPFIRDNEKVFSLMDGKDSVIKLCQKLTDYNMGDVQIYAGENLSYEDEHIINFKARDYEAHTDELTGNLIVIVAVNYSSNDAVARHICDGDFIRGNVPMTKQEIRRVSIGKLGLKKNSVLYDIGAGTGSVSIESAMASPYIKVYAFEQKDEACNLIRDNKNKFAADNVHIISGVAPDSFAGCDMPTHAFIGGSGGRFVKIVNALFELNPNITVVVNAMSLEAITNITGFIKERENIDADITMMQVSSANKVGDYHLMLGGNPVYIVTMKMKEQI